MYPTNDTDNPPYPIPPLYYLWLLYQRIRPSLSLDRQLHRLWQLHAVFRLSGDAGDIPALQHRIPHQEYPLFDLDLIFPHQVSNAVLNVQILASVINLIMGALFAPPLM
jgi:hypothetical protein